MAYKRPRLDDQITKREKVELLSEYFAAYREVALSDDQRSELNIKVPRAVFASILDEIGGLLIQRSKDLAAAPGPVRDLLKDHRPPGRLADLLPDDFRAFCLALNALKQWVSAEQAATDRYLLGGTARATLRNQADACLITGQPITPEDLELHHPVRDGRPPIPVCKSAHATVEGQISRTKQNYREAREACDVFDEGFSSEQRLEQLKRSRSWSWIMLRRGCLDLLGLPASHTTPAVRASSRAFARRAMAETNKDLEWILSFLDQKGYGLADHAGDPT